MQDKIELWVTCAPTGELHNFWVPLDLSVSQAAVLMSRLVEQRHPALWQASGQEDLMLCDPFGSSDGELLNPNETLRALRANGTVANGTHVALA